MILTEKIVDEMLKENDAQILSDIYSYNDTCNYTINDILNNEYDTEFYFKFPVHNDELYNEFQIDNLLYYNKLKRVENNIKMTIYDILSKQIDIRFFEKCCILETRIKNVLFYYSNLIIYLYKKHFILS